MYEVRERLHQVNELFKADNIHIQIRAESGYLQTRLIIELIAQACLISHIDMPGFINSSVNKAYEADKIIRRLISSHPDGFMKPIRLKNEGFGLIADATEQDGDIDYKYLLKMYNDCGNILHTQSAKRRLAKSPQIKDINENIENLSKIHSMIRHHYVPFSSSHAIICQFGTERNAINVALIEVETKIFSASELEREKR